VVRSLAQNGPGRILPRSSDNPNESFMQYLKLSDELIDQSSKDIVAETARVPSDAADHFTAGWMIKTSPSKLVAQGTDWRFLTELKKELKA
jgi:hypothetical protein